MHLEEDVPPALLDLWWQTCMPLMAGRKICKERGVERFPSQRDGCAAGWKPSGILFRTWTCNQWDLTMSVETPKLKRIPDQSNHNENIIQLICCHTLKRPVLQFVNVNGARRPSLFFQWGWKTIPQLSSVLLCIPIFLRASYQNELWCNRFPFFFAPFVSCWVFPARCLLVLQNLVADYSRSIFQQGNHCRFDQILGFFFSIDYNWFDYQLQTITM